MSDHDLLTLMLEYLTNTTWSASTRELFRKSLEDFVARRLAWREVAKIEVRADQVIEYAAGICGSGDEQRRVMTTFIVKKGDQIRVMRDGGL